MTYLDNNATTQPSSEVREAMIPYLDELFQNAASPAADHLGIDARELAAKALQRLLNAEEPDCFVFTSGATESNNWVFHHVRYAYKSGKIIVSAVEHESVAEPAKALERHGFELVEIGVDGQGVLRTQELEAALDDSVVLVSVMAANNETGALQPIPEIGRIVRQKAPEALFHSDATQYVGKLPIDLQDEVWEDADVLSFSAHKFHGPKGIGGLYIRPGIELIPMLLGGGQERGLRSGTSNTPGLAGMAAAAVQATESHHERIQALRDEFESQLCDAVPAVVIHSTGADRLPNTSCFSIPGMSGEARQARLLEQEIIVGRGSACSSGALHPPKTLLAMGVEFEMADTALRVSISHLNTREETDQLLRGLVSEPALVVAS